LIRIFLLKKETYYSTVFIVSSISCFAAMRAGRYPAIIEETIIMTTELAAVSIGKMGFRAPIGSTIGLIVKTNTKRLLQKTIKSL